jgi:membrane protease YdiL (CAAX protease family)
VTDPSSATRTTEAYGQSGSLSDVAQCDAHDVVVRELEQMLGGEDPSAVQVTGMDGGEDVSSLASGTGHGRTLASWADGALTPRRQGAASAEAHGAPMTHTTSQPRHHVSTSDPRGEIHAMTTLTDTTPSVDVSDGTATRGRPIIQYSRRQILAIWAAAALPMGVLAWVVAPAVADGDTAVSMFKPLVACLTVGLVWQFVLVVGLVFHEQRTLRWSVVREALWLRSPRSPKTGKVGGKIWWIVVPIVLGLGMEEAISISPPLERNLGELLSSDAGQAMFHGSWGLFALCVAMFAFNTVLGEELLFRGVLLPRMSDAFGKRDWVANGLLHATYHLHTPWVIPASLVDMFLVAYPARRYRSALLSIVVHSAQSVLFTILLLTLVL